MNRLLKKIHKKDDKKVQFNSLRPARDKAYLNAEPTSDPLEPFEWKAFFEEAVNMGMKIDLYALTRTGFKLPPSPPLISEPGIFGVALDNILERQKKKYPDSTIPNVVDQCVQYIIKYGLKEIGVFQSSSSDKVKKSRELIDTGNGVDVQLHEHLKYIDVHTVAGLLKQYLRELPEPIVPSDVFDILVSSINKGNDEMRRGINILPRNSYNTLEKVFYLLTQICRLEAYNDMDANNLAESFGPVLMWRNALAASVDTQKTREIACSLIVNYSLLFSKGTTIRPALGQLGYLPPSGMSKAASLSTLSFNAIKPPTLASPDSKSPPLVPPTRLSSTPETHTGGSHYMLELYKNIKDGGSEEGGSDEEVGEDLSSSPPPPSPSATKRRSASIGGLTDAAAMGMGMGEGGKMGDGKMGDGKVGDGGFRGRKEGGPPVKRVVLMPAIEEETEDKSDDERFVQMNKEKEKDKDKDKRRAMRKSVSEDLTNKYAQQQKKGGFSLFRKKVDLKKKT